MVDKEKENKKGRLSDDREAYKLAGDKEELIELENVKKDKFDSIIKKYEKDKVDSIIKKYEKDKVDSIIKKYEKDSGDKEKKEPRKLRDRIDREDYYIKHRKFIDLEDY